MFGGSVRLCGVMGQILLCGVVWIDKISVHKKLEKRAEIDEIISCHQLSSMLRQCVISGEFFCFCLFLLVLVKKGSEAHKYGFQMPFYFSGLQFPSRF